MMRLLVTTFLAVALGGLVGTGLGYLIGGALTVNVNEQRCDCPQTKGCACKPAAPCACKGCCKDAIEWQTKDELQKKLKRNIPSWPAPEKNPAPKKKKCCADAPDLGFDLLLLDQKGAILGYETHGKLCTWEMLRGDFDGMFGTIHVEPLEPREQKTGARACVEQRCK